MSADQSRAVTHDIAPAGFSVLHYYRTTGRGVGVVMNTDLIWRYQK